MRKTTEELWKQALAEQTVDSDVPETFRRLAEMQVPEWMAPVIQNTIRNYRMTTMVDSEGDGYPLIDAMTADGQPVTGGIAECGYLTDAIWNALLAAAPEAKQ